MLEVVFLTPRRVAFEGEVEFVVLPGEQGEFTVLPYHKNIITRLMEGFVIIGRQKGVFIKRGIAKIDRNKVIIVGEESIESDKVRAVKITKEKGALFEVKILKKQ